MTISGIGSSPTAFNAFQQPSAQQTAFQQNFAQLAQTIQSGSLSNAQQAYANLMQSMPASSGSANGKTNPFQQALTQIGSALQSGNISNAQQTLSGLQSQAKGAHGHHHHRASGNASTANSTTTPSTSTLIAAIPGVSNSISAGTNILA